MNLNDLPFWPLGWLNEIGLVYKIPRDLESWLSLYDELNELALSSSLIVSQYFSLLQ